VGIHTEAQRPSRGATVTKWFVRTIVTPAGGAPPRVINPLSQQPDQTTAAGRRRLL